MMMKLINSFGVVLFLLFTGSNSFAQDDFIGKSPKTKPFNDLCYPVQAGKSITIPITVTCNITKKFQPYKVSIDMAQSFNSYNGWVAIDNNSQNVDSSKTITFNLTITPPITPNFTVDGQYPFKLYFIVYNKDNTQLSPTFTLPEFKVIVDNTPPVKPSISVQTKRSTYLSIQGCSSYDPGNLSYFYCLKNDTAGILGIQNLNFMLKKIPANIIVENKSMKVENTRDWYVFSGITPNTTYEASVSAFDLAGNPNVSNVLTVTTPPAPPASCTYTSTFCSTTLTWPTSAGAVGYYIYDASKNLITINPLTATSYTINGLSAGKTNKYYITAYSNVGGLSDYSPLFTTTTLAVPAPIVTGSTTICSSSATYTVTNLPAGCSVSWGNLSNLSLSSASGATATLNAIGNGAGSFTATIISCGGSTSSLTKVWVGGPAAPSIIGPNQIPCGVEEIFTEENRIPVQWSISNPFRIIGGSSGSKCNLQAPSETSNAWLYATASNACGSITSELEISVNCDYYTVSPNPASKEITISQAKNNNPGYSYNDKSVNPIRSISVTDKFGNTVCSQKYGNETAEAKLNISKLPLGFYIITINPGANQKTITFIKR